jgi:hypothetical protein
MKYSVLIILLSVIIFTGCSKNKNGPVTEEVWVRIENKTNLLLENATVGNTVYGNLASGILTEYSKISEPIYAGYCVFDINNQQSGAGYGVCGSPLPPAFENGYYTFKIKPGSQGYLELEVIKK